MSLFSNLFKPDPTSPQKYVPNVEPSSNLVALKEGMTNDRQARIAALARQHIDLTEKSVLKGESISTQPAAEIITNPEFLIATEPHIQEQIIAPFNISTPVPEPVPVQVSASVREEAKIVEGGEVIHHPEADNFSGRFFVEEFLKEVSYLIDAGQQLTEASKRKDERSGVSVERNKMMEEITDSSAKMLEKLDALLTRSDDSNFEGRLKSVFSSYNSFLSTLGRAATEVAEDERIASNKLLTEIQTRKGEVRKLLEQIGGQERFDKIKAGIKAMEKIGKDFISKYLNGETLSGFLKEVLTAKNEYIVGDFQGSKAVFNTGGIVDYCIAMIQHKKN